MSETPTHYQAGNPLETALKDLESRLRDVIEHPSTNIWLRKAIAKPFSISYYPNVRAAWHTNSLNWKTPSSYTPTG